MVPAPLLQEKGLGLWGAQRVRPRGFWRSGFLCSERPCDALEPILKITSCLNGEGSGEDFSGIEGFGSAPWTMVEVIQRPAHLCLDKSFSVSVLACTASCSRGPCAPFTLRMGPVFPVSPFLPLLSCPLPPGAPVIPTPQTLTLFYTT